MVHNLTTGKLRNLPIRKHGGTGTYCNRQIKEIRERSYVSRFLFLLIAVVLTGVGAAMSLNMRLIPNPGDGIVQATADTVHKSVGFTKNCFDLFNICITITVGLVCQVHLIGIGLGTVVAVFNHCLKRKMDELAGMEA